jgi:ABC-type polysaccharide/polyol phosphate transport system ATPase subunit
MSSVRLTSVRKIYSVPGGTPLRAVDGISLEVSTGDRLGIIGPNGAGKSTLLQLIAGLTDPTEGTVSVAGHVTAVMTLGIGLRDHASGRENIYLDGQLQGHERHEVDGKAHHREHHEGGHDGCRSGAQGRNGATGS